MTADTLAKICTDKLIERGLDNEKLRLQLKNELRDVSSQDLYGYYDKIISKGEKYKNESNVLIPYLLGICDDYDAKEEAKYDQGEWPDVDVDFLPSIRNYLKEKYSREQFGDDYVCNIATYTTFGLRSSLIDMAKVFDLDRKEILNLTTKLGIKDDEGEVLAWDKALELYDELREYLERNPELADAAKRILHRNRNMGMHASGLIISGVPIKDFVPLVRVKDNAGACSAWVEGLHGTDLGAVGLVKFDFLSLEGNMKIAQATKMVKDIEISDCLNIIDDATSLIGKVSALPGKGNWSDTSYLNCPKSIAMADKGDLKMVFQYDGSAGIRRLAKEGGVTSFDDLSAYAALFRPGPMKSGMHEAYCNRKRGKEKYEVPPALSFLEDTYGIAVYQEQIMRMLNVVGKIPLKDCEAVRKAISKKKVDSFKKYKEMFVMNGQEVLGWPAEKVEEMWTQIENWAGYGFNLSHCVAYTYISSRMLYMKANYPLAFYTSVIDCTKPTGPKDYMKIKDYKQESNRHGVKVNRVDINKSKRKTSAIDGQIYWGFNKLRGVGDESATKMENGQPYSDYDDFLKRCGTDAKANQVAIALGLFEGDPLSMYELYEQVKAWEKKKHERDKRFGPTMEKHRESLKSLMGDLYRDGMTIDEMYAASETLDRLEQKKVVTALRKMNATQVNYTKRSSECAPTMKTFVPDPEYKIDEEMHTILTDRHAAEEEYYGFIWDHPLESYPNYTHKTFEQYESENNAVGPVEVFIKSITEKKGPKATYYSAEVEDANSQKQRVTIWGDDFTKFEHLLVKDKAVRLTLSAPSNGYSTYTLYGPKKNWKKPWMNKTSGEIDVRVFPLD